MALLPGLLQGQGRRHLLLPRHLQAVVPGKSNVHPLLDLLGNGTPRPGGAEPPSALPISMLALVSCSPKPSCSVVALQSPPPCALPQSALPLTEGTGLG